MKKDFDTWNKKKKQIDGVKTRLFFGEREVWFLSVGVNVGYEMDGKGEESLRPVVVIKKFNNESFWGLPLTRSVKQGKYYFSFSLKDGEVSTANLSQLRLIDAKRLQYKVGNMSEVDFKAVKKDSSFCWLESFSVFTPCGEGRSRM